MRLGLAHSLGRHKLKFSPDKVDTMIVQVPPLSLSLSPSLSLSLSLYNHNNIFTIIIYKTIIYCYIYYDFYIYYLILHEIRILLYNTILCYII